MIDQLMQKLKSNCDITKWVTANFSNFYFGQYKINKWNFQDYYSKKNKPAAFMIIIRFFWKKIYSGIHVTWHNHIIDIHLIMGNRNIYWQYLSCWYKKYNFSKKVRTYIFENPNRFPVKALDILFHNIFYITKN